ncbi:MAG TPA: ABC transporter permease [Acidobacteriaceae bacterium]|jgi:predicted permease|nr:ABC transporter permease [Acidobacteriaceae bacterium]
MREQWNQKQGMPQHEARRDARKRFGNRGLWRERMSEIDLMTLPQTVLQDLRYGLRMLMRNAGFTIAAVLALALGIGANTSAFTAYKAMFGRPLDARNSGQMVNLGLVRQSGSLSSWFNYPDYEAYRDHLRSFSGMIASNDGDLLTLTGVEGLGGQRNAGGSSVLGMLGLIPPSALASVGESASPFFVSENYFSVLGVPALRGRTFDALSHSELLASPSVLISENYWQRRFASDPAMLGKSVRLNGVAFTVIGITPHDFVGTSVATPDFWLPIPLKSLVYPGENTLHDREDLCCRMYGRLADGVGMSQAQSEMALLANQLRKSHDPHSDLSKPVTVQVWPGSPFPRKLDGGLQFAVLLIMIGVGMVLVIACANVASLQLARSASRQSELRMRLSLGASRARLIRQMLTESALLALIAGVVALAFTWAMLKVVANFVAGALPVEYGSFIIHVTPDLGIFAYVFAISLVAGVLFGLAPALESSRTALPSSLKASAGTSPIRSRRLRDTLIAAQVAISLVLMIAGSMLIHSSIRALNMATGYDGKQVADLEIQFPRDAKYTPERRAALISDLRTRIAALPGVAAVSSGRPPDGGGIRTAAVSLNGEKPSKQNTRAYVYYTYVQSNYFQTLGIPLLFGRGFQPQAGKPEPAVILSESAARQLWPGQNPIGHSLRMSADGQFHGKTELLPDGPAYEVIGVTRDARGVALDGSDSQQIYLPLPDDRLQEYPLLIRAKADPALVLNAVGPAIAAVDPHLGGSLLTLDAMVRQTPRFLVAGLAASIATIIGVLGLLLASMGIYGTVSYIVVLRTREVGIRMALGAKKRDVLALMLRESTRPVLGGLAAGLVLALGASYLLRAILYGLGAVDTVSFVGVSMLFLLIALVASYLPSRRAMRVDPMVALRYE